MRMKANEKRAEEAEPPPGEGEEEKEKDKYGTFFVGGPPPEKGITDA